MGKKIGTNAIDNEAIILRLKRDDKSALDHLFAFYYPRLYRFSRSILKIEDEIDDLLQEVFVKIWLNRHRITSAETFNAYIFTVTRNEVLNMIRSKLRDNTFREKLYLLSVATEYQEQNQMEYDEIKSLVDRIISELPEKRQQIFLLSRTQGLSNKEIASQLAISEKTVEDHITHAIKRIKRSLKEMGVIALLYSYFFC